MSLKGCPEGHRRCPRCKEVKAFQKFTKWANGKHAIGTYCMVCHAARTAEYRKQNGDKSRKRDRDYYWRHRESRLAYAREYRRRNAERLNAYNKTWRKTNREKRKVQEAKRLARKRDAPGLFTAAEWELLCEQFDNRCLCCGKGKLKTKLTPDHVVPLSKGGTNWIDNIQPLCLECNMRKSVKTTDYRMEVI